MDLKILLKTRLGYGKAMNKHIIVGRHERLLVVANVPIANGI